MNKPATPEKELPPMIKNYFKNRIKNKRMKTNSS